MIHTHNTHMDVSTLYTATLLAVGPSPRDEWSNEMTAHQLSIIMFWRQSGVKGMDDVEFRKMLLLWYFAWESASD